MKDNVKNIIKATVSVVVAIVLVSMVCVCHAQSKEDTTNQYRSTVGHVVDNDNGVVTVITDDGEMWNYEGTDTEGSKVLVVFNTMGTQTIYDDAIINAIGG